MAKLTHENIQVLLDQPKGRGMIVSCYADTSVAEGFRRHWRWPFKTAVSRIKQLLADDHQARLEFGRNIVAIRRVLRAARARQSPGVAVFSSVARGLLVDLDLETPVRDRLVADEEAYLVPLLELLHRQRTYLVVACDSHQARLYSATANHARQLAQWDESIPQHQHSAGQRWGYSQATIDRHRRDHILHFQKELADAIAEAWRSGTFAGVILLGQHPTLAALRGLLRASVSAAVVHEAPLTTFTEQSAREASAAALAGACKTHDERLREEVARRLNEGYLVATGPAEVLHALGAGRALRLVLGPDQGLPAARCENCRSVFVGPHAECPYCRGACVKTNLWQEILLLALRHGVVTDFVESDGRLASLGNVAVLLRTEDDWQSPAKPATAAAATVPQ